MLKTNEAPIIGGNWKWQPVLPTSGTTPEFAYVGVQPDGPGTPVTRLTENFSCFSAAFDVLHGMPVVQPGTGVFQDFNA